MIDLLTKLRYPGKVENLSRYNYNIVHQNYIFHNLCCKYSGKEKWSESLIYLRCSGLGAKVYPKIKLKGIYEIL